MMSALAWEVTIAVLVAVILIDLGLAISRRNQETSFKEAALWTAFYVAAAIAFGISLGFWHTEQSRTEFFAGWVTEYSLSVDNLFIFILILGRLKVEKTKEQLVLLFGIIVALILRAIFIVAGSAIINRFTWVFFLFGAFLLYTAYGLVKESDHKEWKEGKVIQWLRGRGASTMTIAMVALALTDLVFALDSIPAIFGLTKDPYIVFTANVFALMGLRQLYFLIGGLMKRLIYLTKGLSLILAFIGVKLIIEAFHGMDIHYIGSFNIPKIALSFSLSVIVSILAITTIASLAATKGKN